MSKKLYLSALLLTLSILAFGLSNQTAVAEQIPDPIANLGNGNVTILLARLACGGLKVGSWALRPEMVAFCKLLTLIFSNSRPH